MDNFEDLEPRPHTTVITAMVDRSEKRIKLSKNKTSKIFMTWRCSHRINPHEPEEMVKEKVVKGVVENKLPEGTYTPRIFATTRGNITSLSPIFVSWEDINREEKRKVGY